MPPDLAIPPMLDHVVVGVPELNAGIDWFATATGVVPEPAGAHPDLGTHNAIVGLGNRVYLELLAVNPDQQRSTPVTAWLATIDRPTPFGWCLACGDAPMLAERFSAAGLQVQHLPLSRELPDGQRVHWQVVMLNHPLGPLVPFFIDWGTAPHPSESAPRGCRLTDFALQHGEPPLLEEALAALSIDARVQQATPSGFRMQIETPNGTVDITP